MFTNSFEKEATDPAGELKKGVADFVKDFPNNSAEVFEKIFFRLFFNIVGVAIGHRLIII